mgnify:FL=1|jgi:hypothetical protein|tara:strand:- start:231 stop:569 length:339 start_codon:yes stop_codon:yes gene_type:complete
MEESEGKDESSGGLFKGLFLFLVFIFPPLILVALPLLPFWMMEKKKDSAPLPEQAEVPEPRIWPSKRPQPEYDVFPVKADYKGPETQWWDVDDVLVGKEHGRPEDEWWELGE